MRIALALVAALCVSAPAAAKIAIVDLQRAVQEVEEGAAAKASLKKEFDAKQKQLDARQNELKTMKDELDAQATIMTTEKKQERVGELQKKFVEVQQLYMSLQQDLSKREQEAFARIIEKMVLILKQMGENGSYEAIIEKNAAPYFNPKNDVTDELVKRYDAAYGKKK